jgi:hypothetical protein
LVLIGQQEHFTLQEFCLSIWSLQVGVEVEETKTQMALVAEEVAAEQEVIVHLW